MFDPSLRRALGAMFDRHLAHGKLQPVLHPADTNYRDSRHHSGGDLLIYFGAEPINRLLGKGGLSVVSRVMS
jgi:hypothetical protein